MSSAVEIILAAVGIAAGFATLLVFAGWLVLAPAVSALRWAHAKRRRT